MLAQFLKCDNLEDLFKIVRQNDGKYILVDMSVDVLPALKSPLSGSMFRYLVPVFRHKVDAEYWIENVLKADNGFEVLKWFVRYGKIDRVDLMTQLDKELMLTEFDYFVDRVLHTSAVKHIIDHGKIAEMRQKQEKSCLVEKKKIEPIEQIDPRSEDIDKEYTKAMTVAVVNWNLQCLIELVKSKRGDPHEVIVELLKVIDVRIEKKGGAGEFVAALVGHQNFDARTNLKLLVIAATNGWVKVITALNEML